jgi:hypothetical protein
VQPTGRTIGVQQPGDDALVLIDLATAPYLTASPTERRLINLAIYVMLLVFHDADTVEGKPNDAIAQLISLGRSVAQERARAERAAKANRDPLSLGRGSQLEQMAEREGFEPSNEVAPVTRFPVAPVQPLRHLSRRNRRIGGHPPDRAIGRAAALRLRHGRSLRC